MLREGSWLQESLRAGVGEGGDWLQALLILITFGGGRVRGREFTLMSASSLSHPVVPLGSIFLPGMSSFIIVNSISIILTIANIIAINYYHHYYYHHNYFL